MTQRNWAGTVSFTPETVQEPRGLSELCEIIAGASSVRALGSRHSFSAIADSATLVSLAQMPGTPTLDEPGRTVTVSAGFTYAELAEFLGPRGYAVHNTASLPHISVGGAVATATHGSGCRNRNLAGAVSAVELVTSAGEVRHIRRGDPLFAAVVVGLGAVGIVTRVTLDVEPAFQVRQRVYEDLPWAPLFDDFDGVFGTGYSVSVFTRWGASCDRLWVKSRVTDEPESAVGELYGARAATTELHPTVGLSAQNCSLQLGVPGPWSERLPHFRPEFVPSNGEEIQSEFLVPRSQAVAAMQAVRRLKPILDPVLQVSEIRTVAADELWMSPQYQQDSVGLHFTWFCAPEPVAEVLGHLEKELRPYAARPHWGKVFLNEARDIGSLYPRREEFLSVVEDLDPRGAFKNKWFATHVAR